MHHNYFKLTVYH